MKSPSCNRPRCHLFIGLASLCFSVGLHSAEDAHVHGEGALDVVVEGNELLAEIRIPAVNVVGFEHQPNTEEQHQLVENALAVFRDTREVFLPSEAAHCEAESVHVALGGLSEHEEDAHEEHEHEPSHRAPRVRSRPEDIERMGKLGITASMQVPGIEIASSRPCDQRFRRL